MIARTARGAFPDLPKKARLTMSAWGLSLGIHLALILGVASVIEFEKPKALPIIPIELVSAAQLPGNMDRSGPKTETALPPGSQQAQANRPKEIIEMEPGEDPVVPDRPSPKPKTPADTRPRAESRPASEPSAAKEPVQVAALPRANEIKSEIPEKQLSPPPVPRQKPRLIKAKAAPETTAASAPSRLPHPPIEANKLKPSLPQQASPPANRIMAARSPTPDQGDGAPEAPSEGGFETPPGFAGQGLSNPAPRYPYRARRLGQEGRVVLHVKVNARGEAINIRLQKSSGFPLLDKSALETVENWRFSPAKFRGMAVAGSINVPVRFNLND